MISISEQYGLLEGITKREEVTRSGLELVRVIEDWSGNAYCAIFRRAATS